ncbi:metalloendopeptidase OMA1, mitochondrial-like [Daphnia pulicaria]|uniref:metalloendopeptidase OMA1, mitochondrial-like n=1 Tax=Daphnia pulicaria TaxID=35523 RepID=UPI001EE9C2E1|nr:metalloendopeptidase OMA1, mitochondrial-like [Daphnia pulicaria]
MSVNMLGLFRCVRSATRFSQVPRFPLITQRAFEKGTKISECGFHTTSPRAAIPPVVLIVLRPALRVVAFFAGRNFRKWWRSLPKDKREHYWSRIKEKKWKILGGGAVTSAMAYWFYMSHLEVEPITGRERFSIVSTKQIQDLSQLEFQAICTEYASRIEPIKHPYYARVKRVADRLLYANKHLPQIYTKTWTITVLDDPRNMNAFVLPNGNIFVFTGMLDFCTTDDELGVVLGHEISHCLLGHAAENVSREHLLEAIKLVLIALAWAFLPSDILSLLGYGVGAGAVNATLRYPYSRHLENEADQVGIHLAAKACFDVRAALAFWDKMDIIHELDLLASQEWLSTHPSHKTRVAKIEEQLPDAISFRKYCKCPDLPPQDPRQEIASFRQAISEFKTYRPPVGVFLDVPNMAVSAIDIES